MKYALVVVGMIGLMFYVAASELKQLPDYGAVPAWSFIDQNGGAIGSQQLLGKPYVANFIFTSCPKACPILAQSTQKLQSRMQKWLDPEGPASAAIVSISVDPVTDTPERLRVFGTTFGADSRIWNFARGDYEKMEALVTQGFHQALYRKDVATAPEGKAAETILNPTPFDTAHSVHFALVDGTGRVRGFYEQDTASLDQLDKALRMLAD